MAAPDESDTPATGDGWRAHLADRVVATILEDGAALLRWLAVGIGDGAIVAAALEAGVERVDAIAADAETMEVAGELFDRSIVGLRIGGPTDLGGFVGPYDVVVACSTLEGAAEPAEALRAMREVLTYGSTAWVAVWERGGGLASEDGLRAAAEEAGWTGSVRRLEVEHDGEERTALLVETTA